MSELFGLKTFKFGGKVATSDFVNKFEFKEDDYVMFFKSPIMDPSKLISPKGNMRDILLGAVKKQNNGKIVRILTATDFENIGLVKELLEKGEECSEHTVVAVEHVVKEDSDLTSMISAPVYTFMDKGEKFILRALDVIRFEEANDES